MAERPKTVETDHTELTLCVAALSADADINKAKRTEDAEKKAEEKETKKKRDEEEHTRKKQELLPALTVLMLPYTDGSDQDLKKLSKKQLADIIKYYFGVHPNGLSGMNKVQLVAAVEQLLPSL